ncbi:Serine protease SPPA, chloroplastic [Vitis vinifera]|uniref:Serine protease SPPA, chloroplastic n=1 Tax=Vitis vinifera TaxID=29760 RepID=A0A438JZ01_VITVI|nr:Serine protease SPPA, chloroplastic [Vitis vinifera]
MIQVLDFVHSHKHHLLQRCRSFFTVVTSLLSTAGVAPQFYPSLCVQFGVVSSLQPQFSPSKPQNALSYFSPSLHRRNLSLRAFDSSSETKSDVVSEEAGEKDYKDDDGALSSTSWRRNFCFSYLQISDQLKSRFSSGLSLPQICENFIKAAYDPRISGIYLHIEPLSCGWGKVEEIRRHILDFKKSGKFIVAYALHAERKNITLALLVMSYMHPKCIFFFIWSDCSSILSWR